MEETEKKIKIAENLAEEPVKVPDQKLKTGTIEPVEEPVHETEKAINWTVLIILSVAFLGLGVLFYLVQYHKITFPIAYTVIIEKIIRASAFSILILLVHKLLMIFVVSRLAHAYSRYNIKRLIRLITFLLISLVTVSIIFVNWYAAAVSFGLISLILGFALQTPITSFIGWIYLIIRRPYKVGDRIEINGATGDVIDVDYLDTTLWEFGGSYLSTDHPSGRIIKFPNSLVLNSPVFNYSWEYFPYIWNEVKVFVAYSSDLKYVSETMIKIVEDQLGNSMAERVKVFKDLIEHTPIDCLEVNEKPNVLFKVNDNTWIEVIVRYIVHPRIAGLVRSQLTEAILTELNKKSDAVLFPTGANR